MNFWRRCRYKGDTWRGSVVVDKSGEWAQYTSVSIFQEVQIRTGMRAQQGRRHGLFGKTHDGWFQSCTVTIVGPEAHVRSASRCLVGYGISRRCYYLCFAVGFEPNRLRFKSALSLSPLIKTEINGIHKLTWFWILMGPRKKYNNRKKKEWSSFGRK